jgi:hypothetical protein
MQVLWWLVPPLAATCVAMCWAAWMGRERAEARRDDRDEALRRMERALAKPTPRRGTPVASASIDPSHGVAVRGTARRPAAVNDSTR